MKLTQLQNTFNIHRLAQNAKVPESALESHFFAIARTGDELSIVLPDTVPIGSDLCEQGWAGFKIEGPLDFSMVGVLAGISNALAEAGVSIFALATYDTDFVLVKREQVRAALEALNLAGYQVIKEMQ